MELSLHTYTHDGPCMLHMYIVLGGVHTCGGSLFIVLHNIILILYYVHGEVLGRWDTVHGYTTGVPCMADLYWASVLSTGDWGGMCVHA